jgi:hypothetical protein
MSAITDAKVALKGILETVVPTSTYIPARITPPIAIISAGSPYLEDGNTFGTYLVRFAVDLVIPTQANDSATEALDVLIDDVVVTLVNNQYSVDNVSQPYAMETNGATYLAATVSTNKFINL